MQYGCQGGIGNDRNEFLGHGNVCIDTNITNLCYVGVGILLTESSWKMAALAGTGGISDGSIAENVPHILGYIDAKFHTFITICTIVMKICTYRPHYYACILIMIYDLGSDVQWFDLTRH